MRTKNKRTGVFLFLITIMLCACGKEEVAEKVVLRKDVRIIEADEIVLPEKKDFMIAIDPGHQGWNVDMSAKEPNAPGSSVMKAKATSGTSGRFSGIPEFQLNLDISLMLRDALEEKGYDVIMAREDNETAISNSERAVLANEAGADISIRIHANGSESSSANGALALITSPDNIYAGHLHEESNLLAGCVLGAYCEATGFANLGIQQNDTMTGINWSEIPVMILEMGFMTNEHDDLKMADEAFREKMVAGIVTGIEKYYEQTKKESENAELNGLKTQIEAKIGESTGIDGKWAVYVKNLDSGAEMSLGERKMESASLIKLFTAVTVFEHWEQVKAQENYDGETLDLMRTMIRVSDNEATNALVRRLGQGNASEGMKLVNAFCEEHEYFQTHMGRLMLDFDAVDDNYTSVKDCGKLLEAIYNKEVKGAEQILGFLKEQDRTAKLPAGIPQGVVVANKTGELDDTENDVAIVFGENADYIVCVMSGELSSTAAARNTIVEISSGIYQYIN